MDLLSRLWREIAERPSGPFAFRFYLQPAMAILFALRDGIKDAHDGRPPYLKTLFKEGPKRSGLMRDGWKSVKKIFLLALGIDLVYQLIVLRGLRPVEGLLVAIALAIVPYALLRGPANRVARRLSSWDQRRSADSSM